MITTINALLNNEEQTNNIFSDFCPLFGDKEEAVEYAKRKANNENHLKASYCHADDKDNIIVHGDYWIMAVIPISVNGQQYFEVTKAADLCRQSLINQREYERIHILPVFEGFQGKDLTEKERSRLSHFVVDSDGNIFKDEEKYPQHMSFPVPGKYNYYQMQTNIKVHKVQAHRVSHIIWAAFMTQNYDMVKLMTSHIATYCPEYLNTTDKQQLDILELRNAGWQWSVDHINNNSADNAIDNLQMCTLQSNNKLRDIRKKLLY